MIHRLKSFINKGRSYCWGIGFIEDSVDNVVLSDGPIKVRWVKGLKDRWFADPFILESSPEKIMVLAEEYCYKNKKGRIARLTIDRKSMTIEDYKIILDKDTHLSFPFIIRKGDDILIVPENYKSGVQTIYKYDALSDTLTPFEKFNDGTFTDAVLFENDGKKYMITTQEPNPNGSILDYYELDADYNVTGKIRQFEFEGRTARNGGDIFKIQDRVFRPAQICDHRYGEGIEIQELIFADGKIEKFIPLKRLMPQSFRWSEGLHTFNVAPDDDRLIVIDGHGFRFLLLGKTVNSIAKLIKKIIR